MNGKLNENIQWLVFAMKECFILTAEGQGLGLVLSVDAG